ncbi:MAG: DUF11 domain-containing protein [Patescibacteria group bacterium]|jgi:uncharacterized repeat protein (TIGR01451 family)
MSFFQKMREKLFHGVKDKSKTRISKTKRTIGVILAVVSLISLSLVSSNAKVAESNNTSQTPRFNFLPGDQEMLRASVVSSGNDWADPIDANIGDEVAFLVYYHNGMLNSTAHNVRIRVSLPTGESNALKETSALWSDETAPIYDTIINGAVKGISGQTINLPSSGIIEYVPGSTKLFPEQATHVGQPGQSLPDGITSANGVNIGNINGCWEFAGFVTFVGKIKGNTALSIDKNVKHLNENVWHKEITANPGEVVEYKLEVENSGNVTANNVSVKDVLPLHMKYETGTTFYFDASHPAGVKLPDTIFSTGVNLPNIAPLDAGSIRVIYKVKVDSTVPAGTLTLDNLAKLFMAGVFKGQSTARVIVSTTSGLTIQKTVLSGSTWVEQNNVKLGEKITYKIVVTATGNAAVTNVKARDIFPLYVNYVPGSTTVNGISVPDGITFAGGISLGNMNPGQSKIIKLSGIIVGCPPIGDYTLTNTAFVKGDNVAEISDIARSILRLMPIPAPTF